MTWTEGIAFTKNDTEIKDNVRCGPKSKEILFYIENRSKDIVDDQR